MSFRFNKGSLDYNFEFFQLHGTPAHKFGGCFLPDLIINSRFVASVPAVLVVCSGVEDVLGTTWVNRPFDQKIRDL